MTLKTILALDGLEAVLTAAMGVPEVQRNDVRLSGFAPTAAPGVGWKLALADGDTVTRNVVLGEPPEYELSQEAEIFFAVEGEAGAARKGVFDAGLLALATALMADITLGGVCEGLEIGDQVQRDHYLPDGGVPIEVVRIQLEMFITAPTPFG